ncbi:MAG: hypothetical protein KGI38_07330 [Thaumarchaeota archaeon]|nr:hypothetical protein [Nitrososphaerota archaeon]
MGSFFAGIKAGTLSGVLYVGGTAIFNVTLLYAMKPSVLSYIQTSYSTVCPPVAATNMTGSVEDCFASVVAVDVPYIAFVAFFVVLTYAGVFGMFYDSLPSRSHIWKGETMGAVIAANLLFFGLSGFYFDSESAAASGLFLAGWTAVFGYVLGRLYRKYTRMVSFESGDPTLLKILVDGRDFTGKARTFALTSNHKIRAEVADDASFREWEPSGGVTMEDARSFDTVMEVNGEGALKGVVGKKY